MHAYEVTQEKIERCLVTLAETFRKEGRRGDMRPALLDAAAKIVAAHYAAADKVEPVG